MTSPTKRILFASTHCLIDFASGAAIATMNALQLLTQRRFECRAFCASKLDLTGEDSFEQYIADLGLAVRSHELTLGAQSVRLLNFSNGSIPITAYRTRSTRVDDWSPGEPEAMLRAFERVIGDFRPSALLTYGGDPVTVAIIHTAKRRGIAVVFGLHNFAYNDAQLFRDVDYVIVPSEFSARWYEQRLGLKCVVLPNAIDWNRVESRGSRVESQTENAQQFVTFVNPQPAKGVFVFARIAEQLQRRRPDIPILVVESRGSASWLEQTGVNLSWATNLHAMENTPDARDFYKVSKILLVPSLCDESFGLVAAEAMINGIPVLASNRGALPRVMGGERRAKSGEPEWCDSGGVLFEIPEQYTPQTTIVPTAEEVEPWVETIIRLWDDEILYRECSEKARAYAQR